MRPKTIIIIIMTVLLTMLLLQLTYSLNFTLLFSNVPKKFMIIAAVAIAFILGLMVGQPPSRHISNREYLKDHENFKSDTLSDEDRDYID